MFRCIREVSSVCKDIVYYMHVMRFESRTLHFSTFKMCELQPLDYLKKKHV